MSVQDVYDLLFEEHRNVFLSGMGGTGKTYTINGLVKMCMEKGIFVIPTSTTGCSAINIDHGNTVNSALGIGLAKESVAQLCNKIRTRPQNSSKWSKGRLLIIDECSMLGATLFEKLEELARMIRRNPQPFGGMRVLLVGDMLQLPPVGDDYVFKSKCWDAMDFYRYNLYEPHRFLNKKFYRMLARIRSGKIRKSDIKKLQSRKQAFLDGEYANSDILPTILFGKKYMVERYNLEKLQELDQDEHCFSASDSTFSRNIDDTIETGPVIEAPSPLKKEDQPLLEDLAPHRIVLKIGAQVMLTRNIGVESKLVNGSRGVVRDITHDGRVLVQFVSSEEPIYIQKMDFERVVGKRRYKRSQVPLILAWALTIHKSQSATIDRVIVDLGPDIFADGQAYVALSRVRSLKGLYISNFIETCIRANEEVLEFEKKQCDN